MTTKTKHKKPDPKLREEKERILKKPKPEREKAIDEAIEESFPASDPPAFTG